MNLPKYGIVFLVFIIVSKILYLGIEAFYNGYLIDVITSANVTSATLEYIENLGHMVSAAGLTLLITPLFYLLVKKLYNPKNTISFFSITTFMFISFFIFQTLLTSLMDKIVEENRDKRYESYYISAFKYGMLTNYMGYETFIPADRLKNISIEDRVVVSNLFLLTFIDSSFTHRLIEDGKSAFADMFIDMYAQEDYKQHKKDFKEKVKQISDSYDKYIAKSKEINSKFKKIDDTDIAETAYSDFTSKLRRSYLEYDAKVLKFKNECIPSKDEVEKTRSKLMQYFKNSHHSKAQDKYSQSMKQHFGRYIEPSLWLAHGEKYPTNDSVKKLLIEETDRKWDIESGGLPYNLSELEFYKHPVTKKKVIDELKKEGLLVGNDFNYSKKLFMDAYKKRIDMEFQNANKIFIQTFKEKTGKNVTFGLTWIDYVNLFKKDFIDKHGNKYGNIMLELVRENNVDEFYSKFYRPYFEENKLSEYLLKKDDFNDPKHSQKGDDAIKHLYIPPFAIGMSVLAGVLNLVSLITTLLFLMVPVGMLSSMQQTVIKNITKIIFIGVVSWYPYQHACKNDILKPYALLESLDTGVGKTYVVALKWLMVVERVNYVYIYPKLSWMSEFNHYFEPKKNI